ncbi:MAG: hypothetical protein KIT54_08400 [Phycisphaeraceae bacterium]|nr:hypothetical protein [Phycisphaeraceae bacterium]
MPEPHLDVLDVGKVLEERRYYAQNWRKDVVTMLTHDGALVEQVRYSSYGVPFGLPAGDTDSDGDFDLDGQLTIFDFLAFQTAFAAGCD